MIVHDIALNSDINVEKNIHEHLLFKTVYAKCATKMLMFA
jgi:hypothetical protein